MDEQRFAEAITAIDAANSDDPNRILERGTAAPKELVHARLATEWVHRLDPDPSEVLLLAVRAHHIRRWTIPRSSAPTGRAGYLRWRRRLHEVHAAEVEKILGSVGYDASTIDHVQRIVAKQGLGEDPEVQVFEDTLCLVFLQTQFHDLGERLEREKMLAVVRKTLHKMSDTAVALAGTIDLVDEDRALLRDASPHP